MPPPSIGGTEDTLDAEREWDEDDQLLRGTLSMVVGGIMGIARRRKSNIEYFEAEKERRRAERAMRRTDRNMK
jgi:hypothetical protein